MKKISRHKWIRARNEYLKLNKLTNLNSEEKKLLEKYKNLYFNYETIDYELDIFESRIDRLVVFSPLTILIPIYGIYKNWDLGTNTVILDFFTIFIFTLFFLIFTNLFQWISFISALIFLPWLIFYFVLAELLEKFASKTKAVSICEPGITTAMEFKDGKVMLGNTLSLEEIDYSRVIEACGEGEFIDLLSRADLVSIVNWTMIPKMTAFLVELLEKLG